MGIRGKIFLVLFLVFVFIQFVRPERNIKQVGEWDITNHFYIPTDVKSMLKTSCYDCHSNNTSYPWYVNIQPIGWLLEYHVKDGKADLNFDEFGIYTKRMRLSKLKSIVSQIKDGEMPLYSYTLLNKDAKLSKMKKKLIIDWTNKTIDSLEEEN